MQGKIKSQIFYTDFGSQKHNKELTKIDKLIIEAYNQASCIITPIRTQLLTYLRTPYPMYETHTTHYETAQQDKHLKNLHEYPEENILLGGKKIAQVKNAQELYTKFIDSHRLQDPNNITISNKADDHEYERSNDAAFEDLKWDDYGFARVLATIKQEIVNEEGSNPDGFFEMASDMTLLSFGSSTKDLLNENNIIQKNKPANAGSIDKQGRLIVDKTDYKSRKDNGANQFIKRAQATLDKKDYIKQLLKQQYDDLVIANQGSKDEEQEDISAAQNQEADLKSDINNPTAAAINYGTDIENKLKTSSDQVSAPTSNNAQEQQETFYDNLPNIEPYRYDEAEKTKLIGYLNTITDTNTNRKTDTDGQDKQFVTNATNWLKNQNNPGTISLIATITTKYRQQGYAEPMLSQLIDRDIFFCTLELIRKILQAKDDNTQNLVKLKLAGDTEKDKYTLINGYDINKYYTHLTNINTIKTAPKKALQKDYDTFFSDYEKYQQQASQVFDSYIDTNYPQLKLDNKDNQRRKKQDRQAKLWNDQQIYKDYIQNQYNLQGEKIRQDIQTKYSSNLKIKDAQKNADAFMTKLNKGENFGKEDASFVNQAMQDIQMLEEYMTQMRNYDPMRDQQALKSNKKEKTIINMHATMQTYNEIATNIQQLENKKIGGKKMKPALEKYHDELGSLNTLDMQRVQLYLQESNQNGLAHSMQALSYISWRTQDAGSMPSFWPALQQRRTVEQAVQTDRSRRDSLMLVPTAARNTVVGKTREAGAGIGLSLSSLRRNEDEMIGNMKLYDNYAKWLMIPVPSDAEQSRFDSDGNFTAGFDQISYGSTTAVAQIYQIMALGGGIKNIALKRGTSEAVAGIVGTVASGSSLGIGQYFVEAKQANMGNNKAFGYAFLQAGIQGGLELISPWEVDSTLPVNINFLKSLLSFDGLGALGTKLIGENLQEITQQTGEMVVRMSANYYIRDNGAHLPNNFTRGQFKDLVVKTSIAVGGTHHNSAQSNNADYTLDIDGFLQEYTDKDGMQRIGLPIQPQAGNTSPAGTPTYANHIYSPVNATATQITAIRNIVGLTHPSLLTPNQHQDISNILQNNSKETTAASASDQATMAQTPETPNTSNTNWEEVQRKRPMLKDNASFMDFRDNKLPDKKTIVEIYPLLVNDIQSLNDDDRKKAVDTIIPGLTDEQKNKLYEVHASSDNVIRKGLTLRSATDENGKKLFSERQIRIALEVGICGERQKRQPRPYQQDCLNVLTAKTKGRRESRGDETTRKTFEDSFNNKLLIHMATGTGKTFTVGEYINLLAQERADYIKGNPNKAETVPPLKILVLSDRIRLTDQHHETLVTGYTGEDGTMVAPIFSDQIIGNCKSRTYHSKTKNIYEIETEIDTQGGIETQTDNTGATTDNNYNEIVFATHQTALIASQKDGTNDQIVGLSDFSPNIIIVDEAHHLGNNNTYQQAVDAYEQRTIRNANHKPLIITMTATPESGLYEYIGKDKADYTYGLAEYMASEYCPRVDYRLMARKGLTPQAQANINREILKISKIKDKKTRQNAVRILKQSMIDPIQNKFEQPKDLVSDLRNNLNGNLEDTVIFAGSIEEADAIAREMNVIQPGSTQAMHSKSTTNPEDILTNFKTKKTKVIVAVGMLNEGIDMPQVKNIVFTRSTNSETIFKQQFGRGLRGDGVVIVRDYGGTVGNLAHIRAINDQIQNYQTKKHNTTTSEKQGVGGPRLISMFDGEGQNTLGSQDSMTIILSDLEVLGGTDNIAKTRNNYLDKRKKQYNIDAWSIQHGINLVAMDVTQRAQDPLLNYLFTMINDSSLTINNDNAYLEMMKKLLVIQNTKTRESGQKGVTGIFNQQERSIIKQQANAKIGRQREAIEQNQIFINGFKDKEPILHEDLVFAKIDFMEHVIHGAKAAQFVIPEDISIQEQYRHILDIIYDKNPPVAQFTSARDIAISKKIRKTQQTLDTLGITYTQLQKEILPPAIRDNAIDARPRTTTNNTTQNKNAAVITEDAFDRTACIVQICNDNKIPLDNSNVFIGKKMDGYTAIYIPDTNNNQGKTVLVCNNHNNATFIFDGKLDPDTFTTMSRDQLVTQGAKRINFNEDKQQERMNKMKQLLFDYDQNNQNLYEAITADKSDPETAASETPAPGEAPETTTTDEPAPETATAEENTENNETRTVTFDITTRGLNLTPRSSTQSGKAAITAMTNYMSDSGAKLVAEFMIQKPNDTKKTPCHASIRNHNGKTIIILDQFQNGTILINGTYNNILPPDQNNPTAVLQNKSSRETLTPDTKNTTVIQYYNKNAREGTIKELFYDEESDANTPETTAQQSLDLNKLRQENYISPQNITNLDISKLNPIFNTGTQENKNTQQATAFIKELIRNIKAYGLNPQIQYGALPPENNQSSNYVFIKLHDNNGDKGIFIKIGPGNSFTYSCILQDDLNITSTNPSSLIDSSTPLEFIKKAGQESRKYNSGKFRESQELIFKTCSHIQAPIQYEDSTLEYASHDEIKKVKDELQRTEYGVISRNRQFRAPGERIGTGAIVDAINEFYQNRKAAKSSGIKIISGRITYSTETRVSAQQSLDYIKFEIPDAGAQIILFPSYPNICIVEDIYKKPEDIITTNKQGGIVIDNLGPARKDGILTRLRSWGSLNQIFTNDQESKNEQRRIAGLNGYSFDAITTTTQAKSIANNLNRPNFSSEYGLWYKNSQDAYYAIYDTHNTLVGIIQEDNNKENRTIRGNQGKEIGIGTQEYLVAYDFMVYTKQIGNYDAPLHDALKDYKKDIDKTVIMCANSMPTGPINNGDNKKWIIVTNAQIFEIHNPESDNHIHHLSLYCRNANKITFQDTPMATSPETVHLHGPSISSVTATKKNCPKHLRIDTKRSVDLNGDFSTLETLRIDGSRTTSAPKAPYNTKYDNLKVLAFHDCNSLRWVVGPRNEVLYPALEEIAFTGNTKNPEDLSELERIRTLKKITINSARDRSSIDRLANIILSHPSITELDMGGSLLQLPDSLRKLTLTDNELRTKAGVPTNDARILRITNRKKEGQTDAARRQ